MNPWDFRPLKDFCVEVEDRCANRNFPVFSVSKNLGILPQAERFKKRIASADTSRYKVVYSGDFAFDPMLLWSGSISRHTSSVTGVVSPAYCVFRLIKELNPRFLHLYLTHSDRLPFYDSISFGTNERRRKAQFSDFAELEIPVPPFPEQERIVKLLDEADEVRKLRTQADRRTSDFIPALFHEMFGDPDSNPKNWQLVKVKDVARLINGRAFKPSEWGKNGLPIIRIQNLRGPETAFNYYDGDFEPKHLVEKDALLVSWAGQLVSFGVHIWPGPKGVLNQHIFKIEPFVECELHFLQHALAHLVERAKLQFQGSEMKHLTKGAIDEGKIFFPPLPLQKEFASRVSEIRAMQAEQTTSRRRLDDLFHSMLHRAFQGEL